MATVNFSCPHCGKLMGVGQELLGQHVRCPHCKQVLQAPVQSAAAPPPPSVTFATPPPPPREPDSIFAAPEVSDDLFNAAPRHPTVELPADPTPAWPNLQLDAA